MAEQALQLSEFKVQPAEMELLGTVASSQLAHEAKTHAPSVGVARNGPGDLPVESDQAFIDWMMSFSEIDGYGEVPLRLEQHRPFLGSDEHIHGDDDEEHLNNESDNDGNDNNDSDFDESDITGPVYRTPLVHERNKELECCICVSSFVDDDEIKLDCGCIYCIQCCRLLIEYSVGSTVEYPPVCWECETEEVIGADFVDHHFPDLVGKWFSKAREVCIPSKDRVYCCNCGLFACAAAPDTTWTHCFSCGVDTCTMCKNRHHFGASPEDCPKDEGAELVHALAKQEGWSICPECGTVGDLLEGCFHISCVCGTEYCYLCSAVWKSCSCKNFGEGYEETMPIDYNPLTDRPATPPPPQRHPKIVKAEAKAAQFVLQQTCSHPQFKYKRGRHLCDVCWRIQSKYIYTCEICVLEKCRNCKNDTWCVDKKDRKEGRGSNGKKRCEKGANTCRT